MIAIISFLIIISLTVIVTRVASIALSHTGLSRDSARFQARSAFTGVGFTTKESEQIVNHPLRRKILYTLMFLGSAGIISALSSLILSVISLEQTGLLSLEMFVFTTGLITLLLLIRSKWVEKHLARLIDRALNRYTDLEIKDYDSLLHLSDNYRVSEIKVEPDDWFTDKNLGELKLRDEGVVVLGIHREDGSYVGGPGGQTKIYPNDILLIYGRASLLESLDKRKKGLIGDREHDDAVKEQQQIKAEQKDK